MSFRAGDLVKIKSGIRGGQFGRIVQKASERQALYQVEFPNDPATVFFFEDEIEKVGGIHCPKCLENGIENQLSEPYWSEGEWVQDCPIHGKLSLWGWYRAKESVS